MNRVLVLAYYFPPLGGAGVQRTVKLLKHLPSLGYEAMVVTGPEHEAVAWSPPDRTLATEIPSTTSVRRLVDPPSPEGGWRGRARRWLDLRTPFARWWVDGAVAAAEQLRGRFDLVYASMSPFETAEAAALIAESADVPWIADLRDPWALDEWAVYPTAVHRRRDESRMRRALGRADAVVMNTPEAGRAVARTFPELAERVVVVPNGWDVEDFSEPAPARDDEAFRIVYVGYSHIESGRRHERLRPVRAALGGTTPGLDVLSRSHAYLLEAVDRVVESRPELAGRIEIHLAGASPAVADGPTVTHHGYLEHDEAVALVRSADLLFLPMHDLPAGVRTRTVPGKVYEYLASGRPILAALPDGDARDLLGSYSHVRLCRPRDVPCLAGAVEALVDEGTRESAIADGKLLGYERRRLAERLAGVFGDVLAARGAAPVTRPPESAPSARPPR